MCHGTLLSYIIFPRLWLIAKRKGNNGCDISQDCSAGEMRLVEVDGPTTITVIN